jgi:outer membrane protein, multidrug efflux system
MARRMIRNFCVAGAALWLAACAAGPDYRRPALDVPARFRGAPEAAQGRAFADLEWWAVLEDPVLQSLIKDALANNYDLRIAANHVLQAREQLGISRASQVPSLSGFVEAERQRVPPVLSDQTLYSGGLQLSWVLDFWG